MGRYGAEGGIRTHAPFRTNGFQDRLVMTTSIPLPKSLDYISTVKNYCQEFLKLIQWVKFMYIAIDLKSFYASVECVERGLDPLTTNLVVADETRTEKTICLAVSPSLKSYGISGRARLFEVVERVNEINLNRLYNSPNKQLTGESYNDLEVKNNPELKLGYIVAPPRMSKYVDVSSEIHQIYLKYVSQDDIFVYSIDEVFIDVAPYLKMYNISAHDFAMKIISDILESTGITATAGIGTNMYLCKVAMDVMAKHIEPDENGVRIAELDENSYRKQLWSYRPITDFWRVGNGYAKKLESLGIYTMGDIAKYSLSKTGENTLYKMFGVNAELLIDHAWGWEPCTMQDVKNYEPESNSISSGQVLQHPYEADKAKLIVKEMAEQLALDLVDKCLVTNQVVLTLSYEANSEYKGATKIDHYGRKVPKHAHGTTNLRSLTSSSKIITEALSKLFDEIVDKSLFIRRINLVAANVQRADSIFEPVDLFTDYESLKKENSIQKATIGVKNKFGKNALIKGMDLMDGATAMERNRQIGGHKE